MTESVTILSSIGAAILSGGFISALVSIYKAKREAAVLETKRDTMISTAAKNLIEPLNTRIDELEKLVETLQMCDGENKIKIQILVRKVNELMDKNNKLVNGINILINQIKMGGGQPFWQPTTELCIDSVMMDTNHNYEE
jgi:predicted RNase H-like nuclease (RuvC/YqgF family)